ncbi:MAG TPA: hypothetical protein VFU07_07175 [Candidatus Lumbricidophila sp.]|nr:hypothetical protein [Candidatus Lumbricidophila sp.]
MREWCGCGAAIYGRRRDVLTWRTTHHHAGPEPERNGSHAQAELTQPRYFEYDGHAASTPIVQACTGFHTEA